MKCKPLSRLMLVTVLATLFAATAFAQSTGPIRGVVEDESGAAIPKAEVMLKQGKVETKASVVSNDLGEFVFSGVPAGEYVLHAQAAGFKGSDLNLSVGGSVIPFQHVRLKVANVTQEITVTATDPVSMDGNLSSVEVNHDLLKSLPARDDNPLAAAQIFVDPSSGGAEGTKIVVDGVEGGDLDVPSSSVKSVAVNRNPYSAEFGRPGRGRIEVTTRPGSMTRVHHHLVMTFRNSSLDASNAFASTKPDMSRSFWESDMNGPLFGHKGSFYIGGQYLNDNQSSVIHAITPTGIFSRNLESPERNGRLLGRVDYQINQVHNLSVRYNFGHDSLDGRGIEAFDLPERAYNATAERQEVRVAETALFAVNFSNEVRFSYKKRDNSSTPVSFRPANLVLGAFNSGGAQVNQNQDEQIFELQDLATLIRGKHTMRVGVTAKRRKVDLTDTSNFSGTLMFSDLASFAANRPFLFTIRQGNPEAVFTQGEYSYFVQDEMHLRPDLTLLVGLRHELQQHLHDYNNFAPRFSISYAPGHSGLVIRGGAGVFYDRRPWLMGQQALLFDSGHLRDIEVQNPTAPLSAAALASVPSSTVVISPNLVAPHQVQVSFGVDKQIGKKNSVSLEYTALRGRGLFRMRDINAPLPSTGVRPDPGFVKIDQFESTGSARSDSFAVIYRGTIANHVELLSQYTYSRAYDNTSGMFFLPANNFNLAPEWGRSDFDRRHRLNIAGIVPMPHDFKFGTITTLSSGIPFNITTGFDANNDGVPNDRPLGVTRNTGDGPMYASVDVRLSKRFVLGSHREHGTRYLEARVDGFNALNQVNATNFVGVLSSPLFGRANSASSARQIQLSLKASF